MELTIQERNDIITQLIDAGFIKRIKGHIGVELTKKGKEELKGLEDQIGGWLAEELGISLKGEQWPGMT